MTLTLTLSPQVEVALTSKASEAGVEVDRFVEDLLSREFKAQRPAISDPQVRAYLAELREISSAATGLRDPNFTRETIYQDHD